MKELQDVVTALADLRAHYDEQMGALRRTNRAQCEALAEMTEQRDFLRGRNDYLERTLKAENDRLARSDQLEKDLELERAQHRNVRTELSALIDRHVVVTSQRDDFRHKLAAEELKQRAISGRAKQLEDSLAVITNQREGELKERDDLRDRLENLSAELSHQRSERSALHRELKATCKAAAEALEPFVSVPWFGDVPGSAFRRAAELRRSLLSRLEQ